MKTKDELIDELITGIKDYCKKTKQIKENAKQKQEEIKIKEKIAKHKKEEKKTIIQHNSELREKLDQAIRINGGEANVVPDFKINSEEVPDFIPTTPLEGIFKIKECLTELRDTLKNHGNIVVEKKERPYVCMKYMGQNLKYLILDSQQYLFSHLLEDACVFFNLKLSDFFFKDESNSVWPLSIPVLDYLTENPKELQLFITKKNQNFKKDKEENERGEEDQMSITINKIDVLLKQERAGKGSVSVEQKSGIKLKKNNLMKANRENEIILMIEKTFGEKIVSLFFYIFFMVYVMNFILNETNVKIPLQLVKVLDNEFSSSPFMVNFTIFDFFSTDDTYNEDASNYSYYQVYTSLNEMYDMKLFEDWLKYVYFQKLGFYDGGRYEFIEKQKLIGPIRFLQVRQKKDYECNPYTKNSDNWNKTMDMYCYGSYSEPETESTFTGGAVSSVQIAYFEKCIMDPSASSGCSIYDGGLSYRPITRSYIYSGQFASYDLSGGFYFDLDPRLPFSQSDISVLAQVISNQWIDLATRLIVVTFNAYHSDPSENRIFAVSLYIEISNSMVLIKNFDVKIFKFFINFETLVRDLPNGTFTAIINLIKTNYSKFLYLLILMLYSYFSLKTQLSKLLKEKTAIIYKGFTVWVINMGIGVIILTVIVFRISFMILQFLVVAEYRSQGFSEFFPVNYFTDNLESMVQSLEIIMVACICFNSLTAFYYEFYEQIFLTFNYAITYLFAFLFIYFFIIVAYAACCTIIYGSIILNFSSLTKSITSLILFIKLDFSLFTKMIEYHPGLSYIIIFSYLFIVYVILLNLLFVIMLDAYEKVKSNHVLTLLKYSIIGNGLVQFFLNWALKIATYLRLKDYLLKFIDLG